MPINNPFLRNLRAKLRDCFYLTCPINRRLFWIISKAMPTFWPIEGYFKSYIPKRGEIVVDAGAFPGNFTIMLSRLVGKNGIVIALEPNISYYQELLRKFVKLKIKNVILLNIGLWRCNGRLPFYDRGHEGSSVFKPENSCGGISHHIVNVKRLDTLIKSLKLPRLDYIKMDIEGAEIEAIEGARVALQAESPPGDCLLSYSRWPTNILLPARKIKRTELRSKNQFFQTSYFIWQKDLKS